MCEAYDLRYFFDAFLIYACKCKHAEVMPR